MNLFPDYYVKALEMQKSSGKYILIVNNKPIIAQEWASQRFIHYTTNLTKTELRQAYEENYDKYPQIEMFGIKMSKDRLLDLLTNFTWLSNKRFRGLTLSRKDNQHFDRREKIVTHVNKLITANQEEFDLTIKRLKILATDFSEGELGEEDRCYYPEHKELFPTLKGSQTSYYYNRFHIYLNPLTRKIHINLDI